MLANLLVFITAIVFVEPYKRKRLAQTFEERVTEMTAQVERRIEGGVERVLRGVLARDGMAAETEALLIANTILPEESATASVVEEEAKAATTEVIQDSKSGDAPSLSPPVPRGPYIPFLPAWVRLPSFTIPSSVPSYESLVARLPTVDAETPRELLETSKDALDASREFVERGVEHEGRERDLLVVGAGGVAVGAGLAGIIWGFFR